MKKLPLVLLACFIFLGLLSCSNSSGSSVLISNVTHPNLSLKKYETPVLTVIVPEIQLENVDSYILEYEWTAYEHDTFADDWLGQVLCTFTYTAKTDTWKYSWQACGLSGEGVNQNGSGSIKAGERTKGNRWQILNKASGEVELYWDFSWDYTDDDWKLEKEA